MSNTLKRDYNGNDAYMLETSSALHILFNNNIADFTALDSTMDAAFATNWLAKIDAAGTVVRHSQIKDIQAQLTNDVLAQMELCKTKYTEVRFFAHKVFKNDKARFSEFGTDTYTETSRSQGKMIHFMDEMHKSCTKYQLELTAAGMSQASIDEIITLHDSLELANAQQESYIRAKPVLTQDRVETLNECYQTTRLVIDAAMVVYKNDVARRNQFVYQPTTQSGTDSQVINQTINDIIPVLLHTIEYVPNRQYILTNNGPAMVEFYLADSPNNMTISEPLPPNDNRTLTADMLGDMGNNLYVVIMGGSGDSANIEVEISLEI